MRTIKFAITTIFLSCWVSAFPQKNDEYRLQSLMFFCQNRADIVRLNNTVMGHNEPLFVLDLEENGNDSLDSFFIDSNSFEPNTSFIEDFLQKIQEENIIVNKEPIQVSSSLVISEFCDCVFQSIYMEECYESMNDVLCRREYGLSISKVITYNKLNYVVLRMSSYFKTKIDSLQFCLMEFSQEGELQRCYIGSPWWVD